MYRVLNSTKLVLGVPETASSRRGDLTDKNKPDERHNAAVSARERRLSGVQGGLRGTRTRQRALSPFPVDNKADEETQRDTTGKRGTRDDEMS